MQDYWNEPPDHPEPPEWYMTIEDAALDQDVPQEVGTAILKILESWCEQCNQDSAIEPTPEPDYSEADWQNHYAIPIRTWTDDDYYRADIEFDAARDRQFEK